MAGRSNKAGGGAVEGVGGRGPARAVRESVSRARGLGGNGRTCCASSEARRIVATRGAGCCGSDVFFGTSIGAPEMMGTGRPRAASDGRAGVLRSTGMQGRPKAKGEQVMCASMTDL